MAVATLVTLCTAPVIVALLSTVLLGERPTRRLVLAAGLAMVGTILLVSPVDSATLDGSTGIGLLLALGSALGYAHGRHRQPTDRPPVPPADAADGRVRGRRARRCCRPLLLEGPHLSYPCGGWRLLLYLGIVPTALGYVLFTIGCGRRWRRWPAW